MDRRTFVKNLGLGAVAATAASAATLSKEALATDVPSTDRWDIAVVGGGFGGASVAKYLSLWGGDKVNVTLIDANPSHVSCILSNLVLNDQKTISNLTFDLKSSASKYHFTFKQGKVTSHGKESSGVRYVLLDNGDKVYFDKLVMSPGIEFVYPSGMEMTLDNGWTDSNTPFPHAWQAGKQTENLRDQLKRLPTGGKARVIMTIPAKPYRCPPGPYERACLIADYLKTKKGGGKLYVLDANDGIQAEPLNFGKAFKEIYQGIIEYHPVASVAAVYSPGAFNRLNSILPKDKKLTVSYGAASASSYITPVTKISDAQSFHLINVIPNQKAALNGDFAYLLTGGKAGNWAPVNLDSYLSKNDDDIYVLGDAHDSSQPKAGHIADSEAKVCANALLRKLDVIKTDPNKLPAPPVTNSACFSPISATTASFLTAGYRYDPVAQNVFRVNEAFGEAEQITSDNYKMMLAWANNLFAEVF